MAIEIVSFPMINGGSFHSYVKLPEGTVSIRRYQLRRYMTIIKQKEQLASTDGSAIFVLLFPLLNTNNHQYTIWL